MTRLALNSAMLALVLAGIWSSPAQAARVQKEWTFLTFLNGHNNLDSFGAFNINQMEKIGSSDQVNVVVQWASLENGNTVRMLVNKDSEPTRVTSPVVQDIGRADMGDYRTLVDFVRWAHENYPAKKYFINVWDHGSGWHALQAKLRARATGIPLSIRPTDISWDDLTGNSITTQQLGMAMDESAKIIGHKVDVYGSDACLMAMIEVAAEMKDSVEVFVGSQELEPGAGWPYDDLLRRWGTNATATARDVGTYLVEEYVASYQGGQNGNSEVTLSAFDLTKSTDLYTALRNLKDGVMKLDAAGRSSVMRAVNSSLGFYYDDYVDLGDFIEKMAALRIDSINPDMISSVKTALAGYVVANKTTSDYARAQGVSIWLPSTMSTYSSYADKYKSLRFQADTGWGDGLRFLLQ